MRAIPVDYSVWGRNCGSFWATVTFVQICLEQKLSWGEGEGGRGSVWSSSSLVSPMGSARRVLEVLPAQAWQSLLINFGLNKQMQQLPFMLQGLKSVDFRLWLTS